MNTIQVVIFNPTDSLLLEGVKSVVSEHPAFVVSAVCADERELFGCLASNKAQILILGGRDQHNVGIGLLKQIGRIRPQLRTLIVAPNLRQDLLFAAIKQGAKGLIVADAGKSELIEAVYTLRSGHDYFSKSITNLLLHDFMDDLKKEPQPEASPLKALSKRELEILKLWGESYTNKEIADALFISVRTVESHKNHIMQKLQLKTTVDLVKFAVKNNVISI